VVALGDAADTERRAGTAPPGLPLAGALLHEEREHRRRIRHRGSSGVGGRRRGKRKEFQILGRWVGKRVQGLRILESLSDEAKGGTGQHGGERNCRGLPH